MMMKDVKKVTVLVVDDDPSNLTILTEYLEKFKFVVLTAQHGKQAIQQAEQNQPDIILMDVVMPDMDGFETCRHLKQQPATQEIPVLFMTAMSDMKAKVTGFEAGGVDYITKPFQLQEVLARVNTHLTLRRQQQQLQQQAEQLRALNAEKDQFLSMIATDLRSPFSMLRQLIGIAAENIEQSGLDQLEDIMNLLKKSSEHLYTLLENVLTWSRIQQGVMKYHPKGLDLRELVLSNMTALKPHADQKQIGMTDTINAKMLVYADYYMIDDVLRNLLSNAVKFTHPGGTIQVSVQQDEKFVTIAVADSGIGIDKEHQEKLFRIDAAYKRKGTAREQGTGLGLLLCKEFVEKQGGAIWVESEVGKGSTFKFTLPRQR